MTSSKTGPMTGRKFRMMCLIDEFIHEALAIRVKRRLNSTDCWKPWRVGSPGTELEFAL